MNQAPLFPGKGVRVGGSEDARLKADSVVSLNDGGGQGAKRKFNRLGGRNLQGNSNGANEVEKGSEMKELG